MSVELSRRELCRAAAVAGTAALLPAAVTANPVAAVADEDSTLATAWYGGAKSYPSPSTDAVWNLGWRLQDFTSGAYITCADVSGKADDPGRSDDSRAGLPARWAYDAIKLPQAWELCPGHPGAGVTVGLFDSPVYYDHEDLPKPVFSQQEDEPEEGWLKTRHGTLTAGIIAATGNNGTGDWGGTVGVAYGCALASCSYSSPQVQAAAEGAQGSIAKAVQQFADGLETLVKNGARVLNCSNCASVSDLKAINEDGDEEKTKSLDEGNAELARRLSALLDEGYDFVICKASGNSNSPDDESFDGFVGGQNARFDLLSGIEDERLRARIVVVGGVEALVDGTCRVAPYSAGGERVDVVAPGSYVYSPSPRVPGWQSRKATDGLFGTGFLADSGDEVGSGYSGGYGTSFATPIVTGIAAMVWATKPSLTGDQVKDAVCASATQRVGYAQDVAATITAFDGTLTYGLVDASAAVQLALGTSSDMPVGTFSYVAPVGGYRGSLTIDADGGVTLTELQSTSPDYQITFYQMSAADDVDASALGDEARAWRFTPTGDGEMHSLMQDAEVVTGTFAVTDERIFAYDPATDSLSEWDSWYGEWSGPYAWARVVE